MSGGHVHGVWSRHWGVVTGSLERRNLGVHLLLTIVVHGAEGGHHLAGARVLLGGLRQRRAPILRSGLCMLCIVHSGLLACRRGLLVMRLSVALVVHVAVVLSHVHVGLALITVVGGLMSLVGIRRLRGLHNGSGRLRRSELALVLALALSILGHLGVAGGLRWRHLLVVVAGLV